MKLSLNKDLMGKTISNVIVVGCGILLLFILYNLGNIEKGFARGLDILAPFIYGFAFAYILAYPMRTIERKWLKFLDKYHKRGLKRAIAIFIVVIIALLILFITISIVLPQFAENIVIVLNKTPVYLEKAEKFIVDTAYRFDISEQFLQSSLGSWESIAQNISNMIKTMIPQMVDISIGLTTDIFDLVLSLIISVYLLAGKERFFAQIKKLLYAFMPDNYVQKIIEITIQCHHTF
ncbi:MAG: AI-2E family transporter, partial [Clostridiales bacterium]